ncbi:MAG: hypothetical protein KAU28_02045, partial [Phycisphaerae bacterium]|nr:hypothetical protein [Phycisphaerae bacterium]
AGQIDKLTRRIVEAKKRGASVMLTYGAHLIKNGAGPLVNALVEGGWVTHLATHGAGVIHDWEFAHTGFTAESVRENAPVGRFGTWDETGRWINLAVIAAAAEGIGFGEAMGRFICQDGLRLPETDELARQISEEPLAPLTAARADLLSVMKRFDLPPGQMSVEHPFRKYSPLACAYDNGVPLTVHPGIGYDIFANHPIFHGAAIGRAAATDFHIFAQDVLNLTGGVYMSVGSAIMSPQVFEKAFSCANNLLEGRSRPFIRDHYIAIVDIQNGGDWDWSAGEPPQGHPAYYLRFCKSFYRMGGVVDYLCGDNRVVLANVLARLRSG